MKNRCVSTLAMQIQRFKHAVFVARRYLRWPYPLNRKQEYGDYCHEHTCLAAHLPNVELTDVCPLAGRKFRVAMEDACESCPYFCTIDYNEDTETGKKSLCFCMNGEVVSIYQLGNGG